MRVVVVGAGATGARAARQLASTPGLDQLVVCDTDVRRRDEVVRSLGDPAEAQDFQRELLEGADVVVLAHPHDQRRIAELALERDVDVVSCSDSVDETKALLELDAEARERDRHVVVGAGFAPGFTCLLAVHGAARLDVVDEVHVAKLGTGGPACARQHHAALKGEAVDLRDGAWRRRAGGSGRELVWFPDPVGGHDCYRAALPDGFLLEPAFPGATRITGRVAATRRDRLTSRLPMLRRPHPEGVIGAVRVELRGARDGAREVVVLGAIERPAAAAGAVAAVVARLALRKELAGPGASGVASAVADPLAALHELATLGVRAAAFEGVAAIAGDQLSRSNTTAAKRS